MCMLEFVSSLRNIASQIPVYKGAAHPLLLADTKDHYFGSDAFGDFEYPDPPSMDLVKSTHAVIAMINLVRKHPGQFGFESSSDYSSN